MSSQLSLSQLLRRTGIALFTTSLVGCAVSADFVKSDESQAAAQFSPRADYEQHQSISAESFPSSWWILFNDSILSDLQSRAQTGNLNLQIAGERIEQSRAQLGITSSLLLPIMGASSTYTHKALSAHGKFAALGAQTSASEFWQFGFEANWELDLWGRAQMSRKGAVSTFKATVYEREAARVALSAEVARTYLQLRGTQAQLEITRQNLELVDRTLHLAESRERNGVATRFETSSARAQLATIQALLPELIQRRNALMNALALLLEEEPRGLDAQLLQAIPLPSLPSNVPMGLPSELAHKRPDIQRAEAQLYAATAAIGVAKADFYPRIGLRGRFGTEAFEVNDLESWDSRFFSVGPTVYLPIFQGRRLKHRLALSEARQRTAAIAYRQTVLEAWHEVDNALDAWAAQQNRHTELLASHRQSKQALHAAERNYQEGASDYLNVLAAQRDFIASQSSLNASATSAALTLVNLYKSLGGGWAPNTLTSERPARSETPRMITASSATSKGKVEQ